MARISAVAFLALYATLASAVCNFPKFQHCANCNANACTLCANGYNPIYNPGLADYDVFGCGLPFDSVCQFGGDCSSGFCTSSSKCGRYIDGDAFNFIPNSCSADTDCVSGPCTNKKCSFVATGGPCLVNGADVGGVCASFNCQGGVCKAPDCGEGCSAGEWVTSFCNLATFPQGRPQCATCSEPMSGQYVTATCQAGNPAQMGSGGAVGADTTLASCDVCIGRQKTACVPGTHSTTGTNTVCGDPCKVNNGGCPAKQTCVRTGNNSRKCIVVGAPCSFDVDCGNSDLFCFNAHCFVNACTAALDACCPPGDSCLPIGNLRYRCCATGQALVLGQEPEAKDSN